MVFDLDGTLIDSDDALVAPFLALGVPPEELTFGHVVAEECARLGISLEAYVDRYDTEVVQPFAGVEDLLGALPRWGVCSNKHPRSGRAELTRLGWRPEVALFADAFDGPKRLAPVLEAFGVEPEAVWFVGDTVHDRHCAEEAGARFALAGWNPRTGDLDAEVVLAHPLDLLTLLSA